MKKVEQVVTPHGFMFRSSLNLKVPFHACKSELSRPLEGEARLELSRRIMDSSSRTFLREDW